MEDVWMSAGLKMTRSESICKVVGLEDWMVKDFKDCWAERGVRLEE